MTVRRLPPLRALLAFETTARHLSVGRAAEELNLSSSAVSHQLRIIEDFLGVRLFHRTTRTMRLTDAGFSYFKLVFGGFDRIAAATQDIVDAGFTDVLTIKCPPSLVPGWLIPRLESFQAAHPDIDLRLQAPSEPVNRVDSLVDMELRYGEGEKAGFLVEPFLDEAIVPLANPQIARRLRKKSVAEALSSTPLIHSERSPLNWTAWLRLHKIHGVNVSRGLRFDRGFLSTQAARAGLGIALESTVFAAHDIESGNLVQLFRELPAERRMAHFMVIPLANAELPKVLKFKEWLLSESKRAQRGNLPPAARSRKS